MADYVVGSGWWCEHADGTQDRALTFGDAAIRSQRFFRVWHASLMRYARPRQIIVVDSASPVKPDLAGLGGDISWLTLPHNPGHAATCQERLSGYTVSVLLSAYHAFLTGAEHYVYVEQDNLLHGEGLIERAIARMTTPFMFGGPVPMKQPLQQSLFIIRRDGLWPFIDFLSRLATPDRELSPERKFGLAAFAARVGAPASADPARLAAQLRALDTLTLSSHALDVEARGFDYLPFGVGRCRPIDWDAGDFYFQHASAEELQRYLGRTGISL